MYTSSINNQPKSNKKILGKLIKFYMKKNNIKYVTHLCDDKKGKVFLQACTQEGRILIKENVDRVLGYLGISEREAAKLIIQMKKEEDDARK